MTYAAGIADPGASSIVICRHEGGAKGATAARPTRQGGRVQGEVADLKKPEAKLNFVLQIFEGERRRVEPLAAQQLVAVLGEQDRRNGRHVLPTVLRFAMTTPSPWICVNRYLTSNPQVTGFSVADKAIAGRTAEAIIVMRSAVEQGTDPIALIGALAMKLRTIAKASAVKAGTITQAQAKTNPWVLKNAMRQLSGWTSAGLGRCIRMLAWADEQSKTNGGDPVYALERCIELISHKGRD